MLSTFPSKVVVVAAAAGMMFGGVLLGPPAAFAKSSEIAYVAHAYGTSVTLGNTVESPSSAPASLGCSSTSGLTQTNSAASASYPGELSTGTISTSSASQSASNVEDSTSSAVVNSVSMLGGLVSATQVTSTATSSRDAVTGTLTTSSAGTQLMGLTIAGIPISGTPAPNSQMTLPGVGYVVLNQEVVAQNAGLASLRVTAIYLVVTLSSPLAPVGTVISAGSSSAVVGGPFDAVLVGHSYVGSETVAGNPPAFGPLDPQPFCVGTGGLTVTTSGSDMSIPAAVSSGPFTDTALGTNKGAAGEVTSTVNGLNLADGLVTATSAEADVTTAGNPPAFGDRSTFDGLNVAGFPGITDSVAPNTELSMAGIGTLWLHRVIKTADSVRVIMVELSVTVPANPLGLPPGANIIVASSQVGTN